MSLKNDVRLKLEYVAIGAVKSNPRAVLTFDQRSRRVHRRSINELGLNVPLLLDRNWRIVAGDAYLEAAKELGMA